MKFDAEKSQIVESLQNAAAVAERRQTIPILANVRLKTLNGKLEVTATDLEIQIKYVEVSRKSFAAREIHAADPTNRRVLCH